MTANRWSRVVQKFLERAGYETLSAFDGEEGLETLRASSADISAILLDRAMPKLDGMGFMEEMRGDPALAGIPVIMMTGMAAPSEMVEGIEAGVYTYITKPFSEAVMMSIVKAAVAEFTNRASLKKQIDQHVDVLQNLTHGKFTFRTLEQARQLAGILATLSPNPKRHVMPLTELMINAVEHGLAGVSYHEKGESLKAGTWESDVEERLSVPDLERREASVEVVSAATSVTDTISDNGDGFDWKKYLKIDPDRALDTHGRGVAMAAMSFGSLEYRGNGSTVRVKIERA